MRDRRALGFAIALVTAACVGAEGDASAFCRTTTCPLPADWNPIGSCVPRGSFVDTKGHRWPDFPTYCAALQPPAKVLHLWWRNACVSFDVQERASRWVSYARLVQIVDEAFAQWTGASCGGSPGGHPSIDVVNLGGVACDRAEYSSDQANQHVILFHDHQWPYDAAGATGGPTSSNTLGLTTVTFDAETGEIFDADTEINGTMELSTSNPVGPDAFDLSSIITHEMGHFLGMAHSDHANATMYALDTPGSLSMRTLSSDDTDGLCSIYPPGGTRAVDPPVAPGGSVVADRCDPTPRHGFSNQCAQPQNEACALAPRDMNASPSGSGALTVMTALGIARLRRRGQPSAGVGT